jgi:hypothetical protein
MKRLKDIHYAVLVNPVTIPQSAVTPAENELNTIA